MPQHDGPLHTEAGVTYSHIPDEGWLVPMLYTCYHTQTQSYHHKTVYVMPPDAKKFDSLLLHWQLVAAGYWLYYSGHIGKDKGYGSQ